MPHSEFEQTVLETIEHSPVGAVPRIPTYLDALAPLLASFQVYAAADQKDGYVTARSLASRPSFAAANIDALLAGQIDVEALEPNAAIFARYVAALPADHQAKATDLRATIAGRPTQHRAKHAGAEIHDPIHSLFLVPGSGPERALPGNYLYGFIHQLGADRDGPVWAVHLHDAGDNTAISGGLSLADALGKFQELAASAPFHLHELADLGFELH